MNCERCHSSMQYTTTECVCAIRQGFSVLGATIVVKDHAD